MALNIALFIAFFSTAIALGGALAHLFALRAKMAMPIDQYFVVQTIYLGWWQFAYVLALELLFLIGVIVLSAEEPAVRRLAILALSGLILTQAVFWVWTQPANSATSNWTIQPANAQALRAQWEYSHAAGAVLQLTVICLIFVAALSRRR